MTSLDRFDLHGADGAVLAAYSLPASGETRDVEHRVYPGGRHEMFNETNRDAVTDDLIAWLNRKVAGS